MQFNLNYADAYIGRGISYYNQKQYERVISDYSKVLELSPDSKYHFAAYYLCGFCYQKLGDKAKARKDFIEATKLSMKGF